MKIIKKGIVKSRAIEGVCTSCGCVAQFEPEEAKTSTYEPLDRITFYQVVCPTEGCGHMMGGYSK